MRRTLLGLIVGFVVGVGSAAGAYLFVHRDTEVLTATCHLTGTELAIPAGTELFHHASMSEGFETMMLYVNIQSSDAQRCFTSHRDPRGFLVSPYWVQPASSGAP
jgi:hypothetical protein